MKQLIRNLTLSLTATLCITFGAYAETAVKTNILYDALLNANIGIETTVAPRWSIDVSGNYNGWKLSSGRQWKHWFIQPEARYWTREAMRGHFLAANLIGGQFNTTLRGARRQGWGAGAGVGYGYAWRFGSHWGLEAELTAGYIRYAYDKYPCTQCGRRIAHRNLNKIEKYTSANNIELNFEPKGWGLNAYEKSFFFIKSYRAGSGVDPVYDDFDTMNGILFPGWNREDHFRSFWARTPAYYDNNYPIVADDILDSSAYPYSVYYQSFKTATNAPNSSQYVIETTLKGSRLTGDDMPEQYLPLTSIPSVVLTGQYKINGNALTFYTYQKNDKGVPYVYPANEGDIDGVETIDHRLLSTQSVVLKKVDNGYNPVRPADIEAGATTFVVEHPKQDVRHGLKIGGDLVTLQVNAANSGFYFYDSDTQAYVEINSPTDVTKVNRLLYQNLGGAHAYTDGMAFFSAPIQHWGWQRELNPNAGKPMDEWDWSKMKTGDFGIVRNHVYTIDITGIKGLGTGIINEDDPLLPPTDKVSYAVNFRVNIQKWATLPVQKWEW